MKAEKFTKLTYTGNLVIWFNCYNQYRHPLTS